MKDMYSSLKSRVKSKALIPLKAYVQLFIIVAFDLFMN